jgi:hypothetical protein
MLCALSLALVQSADVGMSWVHTLPPKVAFNSHTVCNNATGICRSTAHFVFTASPTKISHPLVAGVSYSLDGGASVNGPPALFEAHLVNGICKNYTDSSSCTAIAPGQMWEWGFDMIHAPPIDSSKIPKQICAEAFAHDSLTGDSGSLPAVCLNLAPVEFINVKRTLAPFTHKYIYADVSEAATVWCDDDLCRTVAHMVFLVSVPDPTDTMVATTFYSMDGPNGPWETSSGVTFFEWKMSNKGTPNKPLWMQTMQWDYDEIVPKAAYDQEQAPKQICFKIDVQDRFTTQTNHFNFSKFGTAGDDLVRCIPFCHQKIAPFHNPAGYCPE